MASIHIVPLVTIDKIKPHPNADKLEIAEILGWQVLIPKNTYKQGDKTIFIPVDSVIPEKWAEKWGVQQYLAGKQHNRVKCVKLRQEPSYGFLVDVPKELTNTKIGTNVIEFFGIEKYLPPVKHHQGNWVANRKKDKYRKTHHLFDKYTDIENLRNYPRMFEEGEPVVVTEKIHGCNVRIALVDTKINKKDPISLILRLFGKKKIKTIEEWVAGSHNVQRYIGECTERGKVTSDDKFKKKKIDLADNPYTYLITIEKVRLLLDFIKTVNEADQVVLYAEVYGPSIQKLNYGIEKGYGFAVIDIKVDRKFLNPDWVGILCEEYYLPYVPILYAGPYSFEKIKELGEGNSTILGANHIREGCVIQPVGSTIHPKYGRKILKYKGFTYLNWKDSKQGSDFTEE